MVKITSPLHSRKASGTIAHCLTFSERKSGSQVRWQRKQKDVSTSLRVAQRAKFSEALVSWPLHDFGIQNFGFFLCGGKVISISSLPLERRAPKFACFVRDWLGG